MGLTRLGLGLEVDNFPWNEWETTGIHKIEGWLLSGNFAQIRENIFERNAE